MPRQFFISFPSWRWIFALHLGLLGPAALAEQVDPNPALDSQPLNAPSGARMGFTRLPTSITGVNLSIPIDTTHPLKRLYAGGFFCGGVVIGDFDDDGLPDLFLVNGPHANRLYRNLGDMKFEDISESAGIDGGKAWGVGAAMVDIDQDGKTGSVRLQL